MNPTSPGSSSSAGLSAATPRARGLVWFAEQVAQRTAQLVLDEMVEREPSPPSRSWTTAADVAQHFGFTPDFVYEHAEQFGGRSFGDGPKPRKRFPPLERIEELLASCPGGRESGGSRSGAVERKVRGRGSRSSGSAVPLLPVRERKEAP